MPCSPVELTDVWMESAKGRAIAQAVSRWLPTAAARVRARVLQVGFVVDKVALLRVLRFPLPIFIPPNSPSSQSPGAGTMGQSLADVPSRHSLDSTPPHPPLCRGKGMCYILLQGRSESLASNQQETVNRMTRRTESTKNKQDE
jgi:hypothetical protein